MMVTNKSWSAKIAKRNRKFICKKCTKIPDYIKDIMTAYLATNIQTPATDQLTTIVISTAIQTTSDDCTELSNKHGELI